MILVAWGLPANAGDALDIAGRATAALEVLPNLAGDTGVRARQQVGLTVALGGAEIDADGAIRRLAFDEDPLRLDLHRLVLSMGQRRAVQLQLGRTVLLDPRGWLPLDGAVAEGGEAAHFTGFAGRLWNPESVADLPATWVGGVGLTYRPPDAAGLPSRAVALGVSWMGLLTDGEFSNSVTAGGTLRGPRGAFGALDAELRADPGADPGVRAGLTASLPVGHARIAPEVRWEGLSPTGQAVALRTPIEWLAGAGYGVAGLGASGEIGTLQVSAKGAAVVHDGGDTGGHGRVSVGTKAGEGVSLGLYGLGASVGPSWVAGGGAEAGWVTDHVRLRAEGGLFRFQPIAGQAAPVSEVRLLGGVRSVGGADGVDLSVELSAGSDRLLTRWVQGGVVVGGWIGGGSR